MTRDEAILETIRVRARHILETMDASEIGYSNEYMDLLRQVQNMEFSVAEMQLELATLREGAA